MLSQFIHGAILGLIVVAVNHFTSSPRKPMSKTRRILLIALVCIITGLINLILPD